MKPGKLTLFAGKMGAGKSTMALQLATTRCAVLISEDEWLASLYPGQIAGLDDYLHYSGQLKPQIKKLVQSILQTGAEVVLDYPANTLNQRTWLKSIFEEIQAPHELVFLDVADEMCLQQVHQRRQTDPARAKTDTAAMFEAVNQYFVAPSPAEGFVITTISR
ncbi:MAG: AAA family ATPase [Rickettsiales bacterium]